MYAMSWSSTDRPTQVEQGLAERAESDPSLRATRLCDAIINAGGRLVDNARIPAAIVAAAFETEQTA
jgi:hypothetical protein